MRSNLLIEWDHVIYSVRDGFWLKPKRIVHDISIQVPRSTVVGLIGPNGAGKTTTIKLGAGLLVPESGEVQINGIPSVKASARTSVGILTEAQYVNPYLKLKEWLHMMAGLSGMQKKQVEPRIHELLEQVDLTDRKNQMMKSFSKGQLQRAGLVQALLHDPEILILDEPMSGLDPYWRYRITQLIQELKASGKTILFSSHILADVEKLCDDIVLIRSGEVVWSGKLADLPRRIKGYEIICRADSADAILPLTEQMDLQRLSKTEWSFVVDADQKDAVLQKMAAASQAQVESLRPIREEIEEVLFGFTREQGRPNESVN